MVQHSEFTDIIWQQLCPALIQLLGNPMVDKAAQRGKVNWVQCDIIFILIISNEMYNTLILSTFYIIISIGRDFSIYMCIYVNGQSYVFLVTNNCSCSLSHACDNYYYCMHFLKILVYNTRIRSSSWLISVKIYQREELSSWKEIILKSYHL